MLDWHRYILAVWTKQSKDVGNVMDTKWMDVVERWTTIVQTTLLLILIYASPSNIHRGTILHGNDDSLNFTKFFANPRHRLYLSRIDKELIKSIFAATHAKSWGTPLVHYLAFTYIIESVKDDLAETQSPSYTQLQRHLGIESANFEGFIQILTQEIKLLIDLLPIRSKDALHEAFNRALRSVLSNNRVDLSIRSVQFYHTLISNWPSHNPALEVIIEASFQKRVQQTFSNIIQSKVNSPYNTASPYTVEDLQNIIALGADIHGEVQGHKNCCLYAATGSGASIHIFEALVHAGAPYTNNPQGSSPLHAAAKAGNLEILAFLLGKKMNHLKVDVNASDRWDTTALHEAAEACNVAVVDFLLHQRGIEANCRDYQGYTPFLLAIKAVISNPSEKYATIKTLLRNPRINCNLEPQPPHEDVDHALHIAAECHDASLRLIIRHVRGINFQDSCGRTPLYNAVIQNSKVNVLTLLQHGADPTLVSKHGLTPLLLACQYRHLGPMEVLLRLPNALTAQCPLPVQKAASTPGGSSPEDEHFSPVTLVLDSISGFGKRRMEHVGLALKTILAAKPDLEVRDALGRSVLNRVVDTVNESMLQDLLGAGADVNSQDEKRRTPLDRFLRTYSPDPGMVRLLFEYGADPDIRDEFGVAAVPSDWEARAWHRSTKVGKVIREMKAARAKAKQDETLRMLAEQMKAFVARQKQEKAKKSKSPLTGNMFSALTVEGARDSDGD